MQKRRITNRDETIGPSAFHTLDKIYGLDVFSKTHHAYKKFLIYIPDEEGTYSWDSQMGGMEGLNQCTWVTAFIRKMKYAFRETNYEFHQLIHGDDYRVAMAVPLSAIPQNEEARIVTEIQERVSEAAKMFEHKIKIKESYTSENLLCY